MFKIVLIICFFIFFKSKSQAQDNPGTPVLPYYHMENLAIAKEVPLPDFFQFFKGRIAVYIKFKNKYSPKVKAIYIFSVRLSNGEEFLKYNIDSINSQRMWKGKSVAYPKQIEKMMEYVRKFVGCLEFRLSNIKGVHQGYLVFGIPINRHPKD